MKTITTKQVSLSRLLSLDAHELEKEVGQRELDLSMIDVDSLSFWSDFLRCEVIVLRRRDGDEAWFRPGCGALRQVLFVEDCADTDRSFEVVWDLANGEEQACSCVVVPVSDFSFCG